MTAGALVATAACDDEPEQLGTTSSSSSAAGGSDGGSTSTTMTNSGGSTATMMAGGGGSTTTSSGGAPPADYPAGPYGNDENDTFPFLTWQGYLSTDPAALATTETWTDTYTSLDLMNSGAPYALIHTTLSG